MARLTPKVLFVIGVLNFISLGSIFGAVLHVSVYLDGSVHARSSTDEGGREPIAEGGKQLDELPSLPIHSSVRPVKGENTEYFQAEVIQQQSGKDGSVEFAFLVINTVDGTLYEVKYVGSAEEGKLSRKEVGSVFESAEKRNEAERFKIDSSYRPRPLHILELKDGKWGSGNFPVSVKRLYAVDTKTGEVALIKIRNEGKISSRTLRPAQVRDGRVGRFDLNADQVCYDEVKVEDQETGDTFAKKFKAPNLR